MFFSKLALIAALSAQALASTIPHPDIPDGAYVGERFDNGTQVLKSLDNPDAAPIYLLPGQSVTRREASPLLEKRESVCWSGTLPTADTDAAIECLRSRANRPGGLSLASGGSTVWYGCYAKDVLAYYCIAGHYTGGNVDLVDVNYAVEEMDRGCVFYQRSYFQWSGTPERIGKCWASDLIC